MGYESLSTVVVLVIVAIIIVVWLPVRTANGMKRVDEHRQDRYSPSLHIVDAENGRRFGDIKPHKAKGAAMPASTPSARLTSEHIAHVRELRRAAIRRRQILAVCLLAITVLVFAVSFPLHFSPLLALIPFVLLLLVLVLGAWTGLWALGLLSPLNLLAAVYFTNFLLNACQAVPLHSPLFSVGLWLFLLCDVCVGIRNQPELFPGWLAAFAQVGMWLFYLPGQVLLVLSGRKEPTK